MNQVDFLVAHPLKHHVFPLAAGIRGSGATMRLITPFYRKGLGRMVAALPGNIGKKAAGYHYNGLDTAHVISPLAWQLRKLKNGGDSNALVHEFDDYISSSIICGDLRARVLVTMQDYLPKSVQAGRNAGMLIWSDQILNSSRSATDRILAHYNKAGNQPVSIHSESANDVILSVADIVTTPSQYTLAGIEDRVSTSASLHVIPYGVDNQKFSIKVRKGENIVRIVARANNFRKGGHLLLDTLQNCGESLQKLVSGRTIEVIVIGTMEPVLAERLRRESFPNGMIVRAAVVPHMSMPDMLASADLFVMPSLSESMSLICIEAMQAGVPLVITPYCGIDCFEHMRMGVETSDNVEALADSLTQAFRHSDQWEEWGRHAAEAASALGWNTYENSIASLAKNISSKFLAGKA